MTNEIGIAPFEPTQVFLVGFDICKFSRGLRNPTQLRSERLKFVEAIRQTDLVDRSIKTRQVAAQFVGDELRLAFSANTTSPTEIQRFAEHVFQRLDKSALEGGWAPTLRGAAVAGSVTYELHTGLGCSYFDGEAVASMNRVVSGVPEGHFRSELSSRSHDQQLSIRTAATLEPAEPSLFAAEKRSFVLAIGAARDSTATLSWILDLSNDGVERLGASARDDLVFSAGPRSVLIWLPDSTAARSLNLLSNIQLAVEQRATPPGLAAVIANGELWAVESDWYRDNFEGPAAIVATRVLANCRPGELAWLRNVDPHMGILRVNAEYRQAPGKRDEFFDIGSKPTFFRVATTEPSQPGKPQSQTKSPPPPAPDPDSREAAGVRELLTGLGWPESSSTRTAAELVQLSPSDCRHACTLATALSVAGVNALEFLTDHDTFPSAAAWRARFPHFVAHSALTHEFRVWKQFHSIGGELQKYCAALLASYDDWDDSQSIEFLREAMRIAISPLDRGARRSFEDSTRLLHEDGYRSLAGLCEESLRLLGPKGPQAVAAMLTADRNDFVSWANTLKPVLDATDKRCGDALRLLATSQGQASLPQLVALTRSRRNALKLAFEFSTALAALHGVLGLTDPTWRQELVPHSDPVVRRTVKEVRLILHTHPERVVTETNNVLYAWIDLIVGPDGAAPPNSDGVGSYG